jgi:hypothetical protein
MSTKKGKVALAGVMVVIVAGIAYFAWSRASVPEPEIGAGQSISNPFGAAATGR